MLFAVVACSLPLFLFPLSPTSLGGADASGLYLQTSPATLYLSHSSHLFLAAYSSMSKSTLPFLVLLYSVRVSTVTHRLSKPLQFLTPSLFLLNSAIFLSYSPFFAVALLHSLFVLLDLAPHVHLVPFPGLASLRAGRRPPRLSVRSRLNFVVERVFSSTPPAVSSRSLHSCLKISLFLVRRRPGEATKGDAFAWIVLSARRRSSGECADRASSNPGGRGTMRTTLNHRQGQYARGRNRLLTSNFVVYM